MANFERTFKLDQVRGIDEKTRSVSMSFSSEYPVDRGDFLEVLSHSAGDADLSLLNDAHPVLLNHNSDNHVATVTRAWIDGTKGRATVKFSKSSKAESVWQDVKDGILQHVSVGYGIVRKVASKKIADGRELIRFAWRPYEISLVPVPADPHVGIGRSAQTTKTRIYMPDENEDLELQEQNQNHMNRRERRSADSRAREINASVDMIIPNHPHLADKARQMATEAILGGTSLEVFNRTLLTEIRSNPPKTVRYDAGVGMSDTEIGQWSLTRGIQSIIRTGKLDGYEADISRQYEKTSGQSAEGFWIPPDVLRGPTTGRRDMSVTTFGQGGAFVQTTVVTSPIEILRNRMITQRLGAQSLAGLQGNCAIPRQTAAATAYSLPETAALTVANQAIDQVLLSPHRVGAVGKYSKQLLLQSSVDIENFLRDDLMKQVSIRMDYLAIAGAGSNSEPSGILNTPGIGSVTFGGAASWAKVVSLETSLGLVNADLGRLAYATTPNVKGKWKTTPKIGTTFPVFMWEKLGENDGTNDGMVNDLRAAATNQIPNDCVIYGNWNDLVTALWGGFDVLINPYTFDVNAQVQITVNVFMDIAIRHAASFTVSSDSGAQ